MISIRNLTYSLIAVFVIVFSSFPIKGAPHLKVTDIDTDNDFPNIKIDVTVNKLYDKDILALDEENLLVYEDESRVNYVKVENLSETTDFLYLVFSIDSSRSISERFLTAIKSSAKDIVNNTGARDKIAIYRFNDRVVKLNNFTLKKKELINDINSIKRHGKKTLLFKSIFYSIDLLEDESVKRKAIIVFTDGKDEGSSITDDDIINLARDRNIPINFICLKTSKNIKTMERISLLTGGTLAYSSNDRDVAKMYQTILSHIKNKYRITYKSMLKQDGSSHKLEVRLKYGDIRDSEISTIIVKNKFLNFAFLSGINIVLFSIILVLLVVLCITIIFLVKKEKKNGDEIYGSGSKPSKRSSKSSSKSKMEEYKDYYDQMIELEESERSYEEDIVSSMDEDSSYSDVWLIEKDGPEAGKKIPIYWPEATIGSEHDNSIVVSDNTVSPKHAKIKNVKGVYYLFDLVSDNGTFLNNKKLLRPKALYDWDEIKIGHTQFVFRGSKLS
ncbi:MAG: VWA domain-containing protein [bacterium]|nr:VWA domain-containing protein [bacterium]